MISIFDTSVNFFLSILSLDSLHASTKQPLKMAECVSTWREEGGVEKASWLDFAADTFCACFEQEVLRDLRASSEAGDE
jgi:hypothetical protein